MTDYRVVGRPPTNTSGQHQAVDYTVFNGTNITAVFNETVQTTLEGITYSVRRDTVPVYVLGDANPKAFSKGRRAISGTMVFQIFDRDELLYSFFPELYGKYQQWGGKELGSYDQWSLDSPDTDDVDLGEAGIWIVDLRRASEVGASTEIGGSRGLTGIGTIGGPLMNIYRSRAPHFADELPPFNITLNFVNELGQAAMMGLLGVTLVNEGHGYSTGTMTVEKSITFFCKDMIPIHPMTGPNQ